MNIKKSFLQILIMGSTPYSNDRPVPQLSIQAKYMHPAIQGATLGVEDLKIAVSNVSSCFQLSQNSMQQIEAALLDMWNRVSCWEVEMDRCPLKHVFPRGRVIFSCPKQNCPRREFKKSIHFSHKKIIWQKFKLVHMTSSKCICQL